MHVLWSWFCVVAIAVFWVVVFSALPAPVSRTQDQGGDCRALRKKLVNVRQIGFKRGSRIDNDHTHDANNNVTSEPQYLECDTIKTPSSPGEVDWAAVVWSVDSYCGSSIVSAEARFN